MKFSSVSVMALAVAMPTTVSATTHQAPWDQLAASLSSPDILTSPTIDSIVGQCTPTYLEDPSLGTSSNEIWEGSNWELIDQPSGACMDTLSCLFEGCRYPTSILGPDLLPGNESADFFAGGESTVEVMTENEAMVNSPAYVVHPTSVADVVAAIRFANEYGIPITVKTSGHHYSAASQRKGTLSINTRNLPAYSIDESSSESSISLLHVCDEVLAGDDSTSYLADACRLAIARGKTAIIRVGGGEVWDAVLRSVLYYNEDPANIDKDKYLVQSGAAGTVSAAGGWLASGGNSAIRGQRLYGLGVDQVLQMEMVLPDGTHVRFGPHEWETDPEYLYPKTTVVKGYCNENPVADELMWIWTECDVVNFNDLWMAVRGGGGGTWGIVTSLVYQLHPRPVGGNRVMRFLPLPDDTDMWSTILANTTMTTTLDQTVEDFKIEFYFNPVSLNVSLEDSNACGCDFTMYPHFALPEWGLENIVGLGEATCLGKQAAEAWARSWNMFVVEGRGKERLLSGGFTVSQLDEIGSWAYGDEWIERASTRLENSDGQLLGDIFDDQRPAFGSELDLIEFWLVWEDVTEFNIIASEIQGNAPPGKIGDSPRPYIRSNPIYHAVTTTIIPTRIVLQKRDDWVNLLASFNSQGNPWYVYGGAILNGHDQMTAVPANRREGGLYMHFGANFTGSELELYGILAELFANLDESSNFPGFVGHNHNVRHGPLKDDWTKACPLSYSKEEMDELCISEQEAVWGTELLAKLEMFKAELDPHNIMTCATGVGFGSAGQPASSSSSSPVTSPPVMPPSVDGNPTSDTSPPVWSSSEDDSSTTAPTTSTSDGTTSPWDLSALAKIVYFFVGMAGLAFLI